MCSQAAGVTAAGHLWGHINEEWRMEGFIGEIRLFAGNFTPRGWAPCDGGIMPINENQALFAILGMQYGGDGRTTFGRPKMEAPPSGTDAGLRYILCVNGIFPTRD